VAIPMRLNNDNINSSILIPEAVCPVCIHCEEAQLPNMSSHSVSRFRDPVRNVDVSKWLF
jgi:hypothetical protein